MPTQSLVSIKERKSNWDPNENDHWTHNSFAQLYSDEGNDLMHLDHVNSCPFRKNTLEDDTSFVVGEEIEPHNEKQ